MTKISIFSGFLGAGKTTLIKKLVNKIYSEDKPVLIENDFSELDIDGGFMQDADITVTSINQGCICCSLSGDFIKALEKLISEYPQSRILIEPSGVGKLSEIVNAIKTSELDAEIEDIVTVADVNKCKIYSRNFGEFYKDQIANANVILLSRTKTSNFEQSQNVIEILREMNSTAPIVTTPWDSLNLDELYILMKGVRPEFIEMPSNNEHHHEHDDEHECACGGHHHEHDDEHDCACGGHHHEHDDEHECACGGHHHEHDDAHECACGGHHHEHDDEHECACGGHHHADEVFSSWSKETPKSFTSSQLHNILQALDSGDYGKILRAKGIVSGEGEEWIHFDFVPEEHNIRFGQSCYTGRLCVIGSDLNEEKLSELFGL